jgi:sterol desaturase/sphingolipid hydroxylase (fatty acid hydroxylase superfamily)
MPDKKLPGWLNFLLIGAAFGGLLWLERKRPLRQTVESKLTRGSRNLAMAALAGIAVQFAERPVTVPLASLVERRRLGLLKLVHLPRRVEVPLAVLLMDYTLYYWHVLTHRLSWLWRFHLAHHVDLDLDVTTALRFHFGELMLSVVWRAGQILIIGVSPYSMSVWQTVLLLSVMFHHSNIRLPIGVEKQLSRFITTPRLHGIHHSIVEEETNSNWSSGLTLWDWLHGTLKLKVRQNEIAIGVPAYQAPEEVTLPRVIELPFTNQRPTWQLADGRQPQRTSSGKLCFQARND